MASLAGAYVFLVEILSQVHDKVLAGHLIAVDCYSPNYLIHNLKARSLIEKVSPKTKGCQSAGSTVGLHKASPSRMRRSSEAVAIWVTDLLSERSTPGDGYVFITALTRPSTPRFGSMY